MLDAVGCPVACEQPPTAAGSLARPPADAGCWCTRAARAAGMPARSGGAGCRGGGRHRGLLAFAHRRRGGGRGRLGARVERPRSSVKSVDRPRWAGRSRLRGPLRGPRRDRPWAARLALKLSSKRSRQLRQTAVVSAAAGRRERFSECFCYSDGESRGPEGSPHPLPLPAPRGPDGLRGAFAPASGLRIWLYAAERRA